MPSVSHVCGNEIVPTMHAVKYVVTAPKGEEHRKGAPTPKKWDETHTYTSMYELNGRGLQVTHRVQRDEGWCPPPSALSPHDRKLSRFSHASRGAVQQAKPPRGIVTHFQDRHKPLIVPLYVARTPAYPTPARLDCCGFIIYFSFMFRCQHPAFSRGNVSDARAMRRMTAGRSSR